MKAEDILYYLQKKIHTTVAGTIDEDGFPCTCAIDMMDADESGLYFLTAKGKAFYRRLKNSGYLALTGIKGSDSMSSVAVSVRGKVKEIGSTRIPVLFKKNPYMNDIYPTPESRKALTVFRLYEGNGEWFDLSKKPIERFSFSFGHTENRPEGYFITKDCTGCRKCTEVCPQNCISFDTVPAVIRQEHCLHCGNCMEICPQKAINRGVRSKEYEQKL